MRLLRIARISFWRFWIPSEMSTCVVAQNMKLGDSRTFMHSYTFWIYIKTIGVLLMFSFLCREPRCSVCAKNLKKCKRGRRPERCLFRFRIGSEGCIQHLRWQICSWEVWPEARTFHGFSVFFIFSDTRVVIFPLRVLQEHITFLFFFHFWGLHLLEIH